MGLKFRVFYLFFGLCLLISPALLAKTFQAEKAGPTVNARLQRNLQDGKYEYEDLYEGAIILFDQGKLERAQVLFELASQIQPKDLSIFKYLAKIYEKTGQTDRMAKLAESVSSYLLPDGEDDSFYEKMLTYSIILNSKSNPDVAWQTFRRLANTLRYRPGRMRSIVKQLERSTHLPFLGKVYKYVEERNIYDEFLWGELGDFFLARGEDAKARYYLDRVMQKKGFDPRYLYSYGLVLYRRQEYPLCQVYLNVGKRLNDDPLVIKKIKELQNSLSQFIYDVGEEQVRKEAELLFKFGKKKQAIDRLEEILLLHRGDHTTYLEMGKELLSYPESYDTWKEGRDYLLKLPQFQTVSFDDYMKACELLYSRKMLDELAHLLQIIAKRFEKRSAHSKRLKEFKDGVVDALKRNIRLFEIHSSIRELEQYLNLLLDFDPEFLEAYHKLGDVIDEQLAREVKERKFLSKNSEIERDAFLKRVEEKGVRFHRHDPKLRYFLGKLPAYSKERHYSHEIADLKEAIALKKDFHEARLSLAMAYHDFGFFKQSVAELERIDLSKLDAAKKVQYRNTLVSDFVKSASRAYANGNHFLVIEYMQRAMKANDSRLISRESTLWLGYSMFYAEKHTDAQKLLEKAYAFYGDDAEIFYLLALSYEGQYQLEEAIKWYNRAIGMGDPKDLFIQECIKNRDNLESIVKYQREEAQKKDEG